MRIRKVITDSIANRPLAVKNGSLFIGNDNKMPYQFFNNQWNPLGGVLPGLSVNPMPVVNGEQFVNTTNNKLYTGINNQWQATAMEGGSPTFNNAVFSGNTGYAVDIPAGFMRMGPNPGAGVSGMFYINVNNISPFAYGNAIVIGNDNNFYSYLAADGSAMFNNLLVGKQFSNAGSGHLLGFGAGSTEGVISYQNIPLRLMPTGANYPDKPVIVGQMANVGDAYKLQVDGLSYAKNGFVLGSTITPANTADASGVVGQVGFDTNYVYIKTAAGWKRAALSTF